MSFKENQAIGLEGERVVAQEFIRCGYYVIPSGTQGARGWSLEGNEALPDLLVSKGESRFVEVKTKLQLTVTTSGQDKGAVRHGIDLDKWEQYQRVSIKTGKPVDLAFYEQDPPLSGNVYLLKDSVARRHLIRGRGRGAHMVYWNRYVMDLVFNVNHKQEVTNIDPEPVRMEAEDLFAIYDRQGPISPEQEKRELGYGNELTKRWLEMKDE